MPNGAFYPGGVQRKRLMILIALGSNLHSQAGTPRETIRAALGSIAKHGIEIAQVSRFYVSEAWPNPSDPPYVNAVAKIATALSPKDLLALLHQMEAEFGRVRGERNAPRTLDLDLIDFDGQRLEGDLELPHPRLLQRAFVLLPLRDVAPDWTHPVTGASISESIAALPPSGIEVLP
jgi:2-amino-4-hydroxy-6-hydroxymethyldihydropteridine diphosphokinase